MFDIKTECSQPHRVKPDIHLPVLAADKGRDRDVLLALDNVFDLGRYTS